MLDIKIFQVNSSSLSISETKPYQHEQSNLILQQAKTISKSLGIFDKNSYNGHTTMTNYLYINTSIERMVDALVCNDTLYFLDDFFGEDTNTGETPNFQLLLTIWKESKNDSTPSANNKINNFYNAIAFVSNKIKSNSPNSFFERYTKSITDHLQHSLIPINYKTVGEYIQTRLHFGGMYLAIDMIEYTHNSYLDSSIYELCPSLLDAKNNCALIGVLSNDLFSYAKEKHSDYNLVNAYLKTNEASCLEEAITESINTVNTLHLNFITAQKETLQQINNLNSKDKKAALIYLSGLDVIVSACYHWQKDTDRYLHPENIFTDMQQS